MPAIDTLGYAASVASGGAFLPQDVRALRTRQTRDLSLMAVALAAGGTVLWSAYGIAIGSGPVTFSWPHSRAQAASTFCKSDDVPLTIATA